MASKYSNFFGKISGIINNMFKTSEGREAALDILEGYDEKTVFSALEQVTLVSNSETEVTKNDLVEKGQHISKSTNMSNDLNSNKIIDSKKEISGENRES